MKVMKTEVRGLKIIKRILHWNPTHIPAYISADWKMRKINHLMKVYHIKAEDVFGDISFTD